MFNNQNELIGFILSLITVIHSIFTCIISIIILIIIIYHLYYKRLKRIEKTTLLICADIYLCLFIYMIILSLINIQTILGDLYQQDFNSTSSSSSCLFLGYISPVILCVLYHSFVNQAFFRLCRIVYFRYRWLQLHWFYIILSPIQFILACILLCPLLVWHAVIYLPTEHYCYASFMDFRGILWTAFNSYGIPVLIVFVIYMRIALYLRYQSNNLTQVIQRRQARDILVIKRIVITVSVLIMLGVPSVILVIMAGINGEEHPLSFRITWVSLSVSMTGLSVSMIFFIPQLKNILWKNSQRNRIIPVSAVIGNFVQSRPTITHR